jgi:hypothetical protein
VTFTAYTWQPWPHGMKRYRARQGCVRNAWCLATDRDDLMLVKGYAKPSGLEVWLGHWWCVDRDGFVVDPTWRNKGSAYVGVETVDLIVVSRQFVDQGFFDLGVHEVAPPELAIELDRAHTVPTPVPTSAEKTPD